MVRWLYTFVTCLTFPSIVLAQCEFLPGLQSDSAWVVWAISGDRPSNGTWFESPTVENSLTWTGSSLEEPVDSSSIIANNQGLVSYSLFISPEVLGPFTPDTFLFAVLSEPVLEDSVKDIWVSFSEKFEIWIDFPTSGLSRLETTEGEEALLSLVSLYAPEGPEEDPRGWGAKFKSPSGELGDVLLVPKTSGLTQISLHGDQPGYRYSQLYLGPKAFIAQSSFLQGDILPVSGPLAINQDSVNLLANSRVMVGDTIFLCSQDSLRLSVDQNLNPNVSFSWLMDGELSSQEPVFPLGPFETGGSYSLNLTIDGNNICLGAKKIVSVKDIGIPIIADILSPSDGTVFCDSDVELIAASPAPGSDIRWKEINNDSSVTISPTSNTTALVSVSSLGSFDLELEVSNSGCANRDTVSLFFLDTFDLEVGEDTSICPGDTLTIGSSNIEGLQYEWFPKDFIEEPDRSQSSVYPTATTVYLLVARDPEEDCLASEDITIQVFPAPQIDGVRIQYSQEEFADDCGGNVSREIQNGVPFELSFQSSSGSQAVEWEIDPSTAVGVDFSANETTGFGTLSHVLTLLPTFSEGTISYLGIIQDEQCGLSDTCTYTLTVVPGDGPLLIPQAITPNGDGLNDIWAIQNMDPTKQYQVQVFNRSGGMVYQANNYFSLNNWDGGSLPDGSYWYRIEESNSSNTEVYTGGLYLQRNPK